MNGFGVLAVSGTLQLEGGGSITGGTLTDAGGGTIESSGGGGGTLNGVAISSGSTYAVSNASQATLEGTIVNNGELFVDATNSTATVNIASSGATLSGTGTVVLSNNANNAITGSSGAELANASDTIEGSGQIDGLAALDNQADGTIDATQSTALQIFSIATLTNEGLVEATNGGTLELTDTTLTQNKGGADGDVEASGSGSSVQLSGATIVGGTLTASAGGVIESVGGNGAQLDGVTISTGTVFTDSNNSSLTLSGTITNDGEILDPALTP